MATELRQSGIEVVGPVPWGTHFAFFYGTKDDLIEAGVPYFKAGLENNEFCLCVTSELTEQEVRNAMTKGVPDAERYLADGSMEIVSAQDWYLNRGAFDVGKVLSGWKRKLAQALEAGYAGMRASGNTLWLEKHDWANFDAYEGELVKCITNLRMIYVCSYPLANSGASEILDVSRTHQFTVARRRGNWEVLETQELKQAKAEIQTLNQVLEQRVIDRTSELTTVNAELRRALDEIDKLRRHLELENVYLREEVGAASDSGTILGTSAGVRRVLERIEMVAPTDAAVLILGETGVGKELVARAIHEGSPRRQRPLVKVNCTAVPRELFESEFFGHVKGAFSGALKDRVGRFQFAEGGTLFLDEIGDLPIEMQSKLLRVLQEGEFEAVGDNQTRRADVRIIAASNHDLKSAAGAGKFRPDLYYRLSVFPIEVPPLRERKEDIPILATHFLEAACKRFSRSGLELTDSQIQRLQSYDWPGNVRELQNVIERAVISARSGSPRFDPPEAAESGSSPQPIGDVAVKGDSRVLPDSEMKHRERENILAALKRSNGKIYGPGGAADLLGMRPSTLSTRVKKLGLSKANKAAGSLLE